MENMQITKGNLYHARNNMYFSSMKEEKKIDWLFPDCETEVSVEDYRKKVSIDEHSGDMSFKKFTESLEAWETTRN